MAYICGLYGLYGYVVVACILMAYVFMAHIVTTHLVMAYKVMACIVMAYIVMAWIVMAGCTAAHAASRCRGRARPGSKRTPSRIARRTSSALVQRLQGGGRARPWPKHTSNDLAETRVYRDRRP